MRVDEEWHLPSGAPNPLLLPDVATLVPTKSACASRHSRVSRRAIGRKSSLSLPGLAGGEGPT